MKKLLSIFVSLSMLISSLLYPVAYIFAQEETPLSEPTPIVVGETTVSPVPEPTIEPSAEPTINPTPEATIIPKVEPTSNEDVGITVDIPEDETPIITKNIFLENKYNNISLLTDKLDYSPTEVASITGSGFIANKIYTIIVSSTDDPATTHKDVVTADSAGNISYSYQLDGIYRPNYKVEIKDAEIIVATVTFTDGAPRITVIGAGTGNGVITSNDGFINCTILLGVASGSCTKLYGGDVSVTLTSVAGSESVFSGWDNGCSGTDPCTVILNGDDDFSRTAIFDLVDTTAPTATINYSTTSWTNGNVIATLNPSETVTVTNNGGSTSYTFITNGTFTFDFMDLAGNTGSAMATVSNIDTAPPSSLVSSPTYDAGGNISVTFTSSDSVSESGVASTNLWFRRNTGSGFGTWVNSGLNKTGTSGTFAFNPSNIDGQYEFYSISTDNAGNTELPPAVADDTTLYDNKNPSGNWITPTAGSLLRGTNNLEVSATDNDANINSGVKQVRFRYKPSGGSFVTISTDTTSPYKRSWNTTSLSDGDYILRAIITDNAGNTRNLDINVTLDNTSPSLSSQTTYSGWYNSDQVSDFSYTDLNGIASGTPVSCDITTEGLAQTCSVTPNVCDNAGNCNNTLVTSNSADIDKTSPTGSWVNPINGQTISGSTSLNFNADDSLSGVSSIVYSYSSDGIIFTNIGSDIWNTTGLVLGDYILRATVTDNAGNTTNFDENVGVAAVVSNESGVGTTTTSATITWTTDRLTTSRVVYDTVSHGSLGESPNYGYVFSTDTFDSDPKVLAHTLTITGLSAGTTYHYRTISAGSPTAIGEQHSFATLSNAGAPSSSGVATGGQVLGASTFGGSRLGFRSNQNQLSENEEVLGVETQNDELITPKPTIKPEVKALATKNWNLKNILLICFGFLLIIIAFLFSRRKK